MLHLTILKYLIVFLLVKMNSSETEINLNKSNLSEWVEYKSRAGVDYKNLAHNASEEEQRIQIFSDNLERINAHNLQPRQKFFFKKPTYKMGLNHLAHLSLEEISNRYSSSINMSEIEYSAKFLLQKRNSTAEEELSIPTSCSDSKRTKRNVAEDSVNWSERGHISPPTDQGGCGACYAFAVAWAVESAYAIKYNVRFNVNQFSKQQLIDCTYYTEKDNNKIVYNNLGCMGGNVYRTMLYIFNNGLELEADYPYISDKSIQNNGQIQRCMYNTYKFSLKINNYYGINFRDIEEMKRVVSRQPVVAYFYVTYEFYFYSSGIFSTNQCGRDNCERVNHAVLIVGYGVQNGVSYWLCKNSWGQSWGENGYFKIEMGTNMCCVEAFSMYPYL